MVCDERREKEDARKPSRAMFQAPSYFFKYPVATDYARPVFFETRDAISQEPVMAACQSDVKSRAAFPIRNAHATTGQQFIF